MDINLSEDFLSKLEVQIKQTELNITKEKESVLLGIECMMEEATDKKEILSLVKQYDEAEKKFDQKILNQKNRIIEEYLITMEKLMKQIKKVYWKELKNKKFRNEVKNE